MQRYKNSYRMIHFNSANCGDAVTTIDKKTYDEIKNIKPFNITFHGNKVVKTINVHDYYEMYNTIRNIYYKKRLNNLKKGL